MLGKKTKITLDIIKEALCETDKLKIIADIEEKLDITHCNTLIQRAIQSKYE